MALVNHKIKKLRNIQVVKNNDKNRPFVFVVITKYDDFKELIIGKEYYDFSTLKNRAKYHIKKVGIYLLGIKYNKDKNNYVLFDSSVRNKEDFEQNYEEIDNISIDEFNVDHWKEMDYIIIY